jgi:predicted butyrate kinase (DUF1464 family)
MDPGTLSVDLCGIHDGSVFLDRSIPTNEALRDASVLAGLLEAAAPLDLVAGPSGYGLPVKAVQDLTDTDIRLAFLAAKSESGGIEGLGSLLRRLGRSSLPIVVTPGVVHLPTVPAHRKVNRIDMGTADKVCAAALAVHDQATRRGCDVREVSFILLELGGAFTAVVAVDGGQIVDGIGGTSGPLGLRASGALDGEVAFLAGHVTKGMLFRGGAAAIAGTPDAQAHAIASPSTPAGRLAWDAYVEGAVKATAALLVSVPHPSEVLLSGRLALIGGVREQFQRRLADVMGVVPVRVVAGFASAAGQAAQGAALIAEGLAGGRSAPLVDTLEIRAAAGSVLDYLHVIDPALARARLGIT